MKRGHLAVGEKHGNISLRPISHHFQFGSFVVLIGGRQVRAAGEDDGQRGGADLGEVRAQSVVADGADRRRVDARHVAVAGARVAAGAAVPRRPHEDVSQSAPTLGHTIELSGINSAGLSWFVLPVSHDAHVFGGLFQSGCCECAGSFHGRPVVGRAPRGTVDVNVVVVVENRICLQTVGDLTVQHANPCTNNRTLRSGVGNPLVLEAKNGCVKMRC